MISFCGGEAHEPLSADWTHTCPHVIESKCLAEPDEELGGELNCCYDLNSCLAVHEPGKRPDICDLCKQLPNEGAVK